MTVHRLEDKTYTLIRTEEEERPEAAPRHTAAPKHLNQTGATVVLCYVMNLSIQRTHSAPNNCDSNIPRYKPLKVRIWRVGVLLSGKRCVS